MSDNISSNKVWIVGAGNMAKVYAKVLTAMNIPFIVIGNSAQGVEAFKEATGIDAFIGGIDAYLEKASELPRFAVNAVKTPVSAHTLLALMDSGVKSILSEKPAGLCVEEVDAVADKALKTGSRVNVGYNRRFYASVEKAREYIGQDGGVTSFQFEFTELYKVISTKEGDVSRWFYGNSTHVLDLAFHLGGLPVSMSSYIVDRDECYTTATRFAGAGRTDSGALFSYGTNWLSPGRWSLDVMTRKHRLVFRPMEKLQVQQLGSFTLEEVDIDDAIDKEYKPGIFRQVEAFINDPSDPRFLTISEQCKAMRVYRTIHEGGSI